MIIQASKNESLSTDPKSGLITIAERLRSSVTTATTFLPVFGGPAEEHFRTTRNVHKQAEARESGDATIVTVKAESDDGAHTETGEATSESALAALQTGSAVSKYSNLLQDPEYKAKHDAYLKSKKDPTAAESQKEASAAAAAPEGSEDVFEKALQALQSGKASQSYGERMMDPELKEMHDAYLRKLEEEGSEDDDF